MPFKDHFSQQANDYAKYRPHYPPALFEYLAVLAPAREQAWDCATGNGQAALGLAPYFARVHATDASARQIEQAIPHKRIAYHVAAAERSGIASHSVDLVTVAQALHWFHFEEIAAPEFFMETEWRLDDMIGYLRTWSATQRFIAQKKNDPLVVLGENLHSAWGDAAATKRIQWPLHMRVGRR